MTKTSVSLSALMLIAACSATASPNMAAASVSAPAAVEAPVIAPAPAPAPAPPRVSHAAQRASAAAPVAVRAVPACQIRMSPTANGVLIQATARADRPFDGEYALIVTKSGGGGSADINQGGPVSVAAGEVVTLGSTELGADGRYRAVLTLSDGSGEVCRQERRS
ncbi:MAG: hypothetical protein HY054_01650 [Proteobacteria bacterium]|nr:hypothetical protein [Pseudomonadota bacterium]